MGANGDVLSRLDAQLRAWVDERDFSGVALITRGGAVEFEGCYGLANRADGVPVRPGSRFGLASVTKMFTATALVDLVGRGKVGFDTPVVDVLPAVRRPSTLLPDVTVHHLLSHTSGIADYFEEEDPDVGDFGALWIDRPSYRMLRPADFLPLFGDRPPYRGPGQRFQYSNAGYVVLGLLVEELTGQPYPDAISSLVLEPAGMAASGFFMMDEVRPDIAVGYLPPPEPGGLWRSNIFAIPSRGGADGGLQSTAGDLDKFLYAFASGDLVGADGRDAMLTPRTPIEGDMAMGYGTFLYGSGDTFRYGHGGGDPGYEALIHHLPTQAANTIVACNVNGLAGDIRTLLVEATFATA
jgi:CubicO group peptidase (beta-lactamase class C family)